MSNPGVAAGLFLGQNREKIPAATPESGFGIAILINTDQSVAWTGLMQIERELIKKAEDLLGL